MGGKEIEHEPTFTYGVVQLCAYVTNRSAGIRTPKRLAPRHAV